jgi:hypothetical protein
MSTRATIEISDGDETFYVYRHSDGCPKNIMPDIENAILKCKYGATGVFASIFLGMTFNPNKSLPDYEITTCFHEDESYRYFVKYSKERKQWGYWVE